MFVLEQVNARGMGITTTIYKRNAAMFSIKCIYASLCAILLSIEVRSIVDYVMIFKGRGQKWACS